MKPRLVPFLWDHHWQALIIKTCTTGLVMVTPMLFNNRIIHVPHNEPMFYDHGWCYDRTPGLSHMEAVLAAMEWNPDTEHEPAGYKKRATAGKRQAPQVAQP